MSNLHEELAQLQSRWNELSFMLNSVDSKDPGSKEQEIYSKAAFMMLCAHFEGGFYDTLRAILNDINDAHMYNHIPKPLIDAHIKYTLLGSANAERKLVNRIREKLLDQNVDFTINSDFLDHSSNLTPDAVSQCCTFFGVKDIISLLYRSDFEDVFQDDTMASEQFIKKELNYLKRSTKNFPYSINTKRHNLQYNKNNISLYKDFLTNLIAQRNGVVHGNGNAINPTIEDIHQIFLKIQILTLATIYCFGAKLEKL